MFEQQLHDIVVRLVGGNVEGGEELLVLVVQVAPLSEIEIKGNLFYVIWRRRTIWTPSGKKWEMI